MTMHAHSDSVNRSNSKFCLLKVSQVNQLSVTDVDKDWAGMVVTDCTNVGSAKH